MSVLLISGQVNAETISIVVPTNAAPRVEFGAEKIAEALKAVKVDAVVVHSEKGIGGNIILNQPHEPAGKPEGFTIYLTARNDLAVISTDDSGTLYGCLELAKHIRDDGKLPTVSVANLPLTLLAGRRPAPRILYFVQDSWKKRSQLACMMPSTSASL